MIDSRATNFTPFSMRGPVAAGPSMQGMQVAPPGYQAPHMNFNMPRMAMSPQLAAAMASRSHAPSPTGGMVQGMPAVGMGNHLPGAMGAPTMPVAGAQPVQGMNPAGQPPTGMNPQYQQALVSSLRNSGQ